MAAAPPGGGKEKEKEAEAPRFGQADPTRSMAALRKKCPALYGRRSVGALLEEKELDSLDQEPGPGAYFGPESNGFSAIGKQKFSRHKTEPSVPFAKTGWTEWKGVFITKGHRPANAGEGIPGPGSTFQDLCTLDLEHGAGMSKSNRFSKKDLVTQSPGPK